ncbi:unnamed protein product [Ambrosiozyma monospora]|uniref:Unnamed protein product n=1 Tax=Ambrosiozyma monospora TaxID=43982 RepID=A0ACB5TIX5_AMBMO|nr:unnamed protein product [Ambrosiozyma monospora]
MTVNGSRSSIYSIASLGDNSNVNLNSNSNNMNRPSSVFRKNFDHNCFPTLFAVTRTPSEEVGLMFESSDIKKLAFKKSQLSGSSDDLYYPLTVPIKKLIIHKQQEKEKRDTEKRKTMMKLLDKSEDGVDGEEKKKRISTSSKEESEKDQRMSPQKKMLLQMQQVAYGEEPVPCYIEDTIDDKLDNEANGNKTASEDDGKVNVIDDDEKNSIPHNGGEMKGIIAGIANRLVCHLGLEQLSYISMANCCVVLIPDNYVKLVEDMLNQL